MQSWIEAFVHDEWHRRIEPPSGQFGSLVQCGVQWSKEIHRLSYRSTKKPLDFQEKVTRNLQMHNAWETRIWYCSGSYSVGGGEKQDHFSPVGIKHDVTNE